MTRTLMSFSVLLSLSAWTACGKPTEASVTNEPAAAKADDEGEEAAGTEPGTEGDEQDAPPPAAVAKSGQGASALAGEAARQLAAMRSTAYTHQTSVDERAGRFDYDCSGFVDYALGNVAPEALADLRHATVKRPLAKHFVTFFETNPSGHWARVMKVTDLAPGDVLAWLRPADVTTKNTGHVMIVREAPHRDAKRADEIVVPIWDSTHVRHGKSDSRYSEQSNAGGLGTGEVLLIIDPNGVPLRYRWSRGSKAREHTTTIAMAHLL